MERRLPDVQGRPDAGAQHGHGARDELYLAIPGPGLEQHHERVCDANNGEGLSPGSASPYTAGDIINPTERDPMLQLER